METAAKPDARRALPAAIKATGGTRGTPATGDPPPVGTADEPRTAGVGVGVAAVVAAAAVDVGAAVAVACPTDPQLTLIKTSPASLASCAKSVGSSLRKTKSRVHVNAAADAGPLSTSMDSPGDRNPKDASGRDSSAVGSLCRFQPLISTG
jgi:hypothetical protein